MAVTDLITLLLSLFFMVRGSSCGFMNSLINPFSIIVTTILSITYYQSTKNMVVSLAIGLVGPVVLNLLLKALLGSWSRATNTDIKPNIISRLGGATVSLVWGWVFIIFTLILLTALPSSWGKIWTNMHNDVAGSVSYLRIAKPLEKNFIPLLTAGDPDLSQKVTTILSAPPKQTDTTVTNMASSPDANSLAQDPRFQKILQDPEIQNEIKAHDIVKLMSNPKMMALTQEIMSDPTTMKKVFAVYGAQTQSQADPASLNSSN